MKDEGAQLCGVASPVSRCFSGPSAFDSGVSGASTHCLLLLCVLLLFVL